MSIVWIANEAGHDYEDAKRFGDLKPLTLGNINPLQVDRVNRHIARGIAKYVTRDDYLLISGTPIVNASAVLYWIVRFGEVRILQWNAKQRKYELSTLSFKHVENQLEREMLR